MLKRVYVQMHFKVRAISARTRKFLFVACGCARTLCGIGPGELVYLVGFLVDP